MSPLPIVRIFTGRGDPHCRNSSRRSRRVGIQELKCSGSPQSRCSWCMRCEHWFEPWFCYLSQGNQPAERNPQRVSAIGLGNCSCETWERVISKHWRAPNARPSPMILEHIEVSSSYPCGLTRFPTATSPNIVFQGANLGLPTQKRENSIEWGPPC